MKPWFAAATLLFAVGAQAQTVWRCGPEGRSYSDSPCPQGRLVAAGDTRSPAALQEAREVAARQQRLADKLVHDRQQQEALERRAAPKAVKAKAAKAPKAPPKTRYRPPGDDRIWRAVAPASRHAKG
jgi:hypothetical protein